MNGKIKFLVNTVLLSSALIALQSRAATVTFQGSTYDVSVVPLGTTVPSGAGRDLIFVNLVVGGTPQRFLEIPTDSTVRACFDPGEQAFLKLDRTNGTIVKLQSIAGTFINLDGTFNSTKQDLPNPPQQVVPLPTAVLNTTLPADVQILYDPGFTDDTILGYRTSETTVYELDGSGASVFVRATDPAANYVATGAVSFEWDVMNQTLLFVQGGLQDSAGNALPNRISAYTRNKPALKFDEILLDNNPNIPGYKGTASGIAYDITNGDFYVLDSSQMIVFKRLVPALTSITPSSGNVQGGTKISLNGTLLPSDATVTIDGITADNITFVSSNQITCFTPAHAPGQVAVILTSASLPNTLQGNFTYVDPQLGVSLSALPNQGDAPLTVTFTPTVTVNGGAVARRAIDFGDAQQYTFATGDTSVMHTYNSNGTFTATFTATDQYGIANSASAMIVSGTGGDDITAPLMLTAFKMQLNPNNDGSSADTLTDTLSMAGQVVLPDGLTPDDFSVHGLTIQIKNAKFSVDSIPLKLKTQKFSMRLLKGKKYAVGTYSFTLKFTDMDLYGAKIDDADLINGRGQLPVNMTFTTALGRKFSFEKVGANQVVVDQKQNKKGSVLTSLTRP